MIEPTYADAIALLGEDEVARAAALIRLAPQLGAHDVEPPGCDSAPRSSAKSWIVWLRRSPRPRRRRSEQEEDTMGGDTRVSIVALGGALATLIVVLGGPSLEAWRGGPLPEGTEAAFAVVLSTALAWVLPADALARLSRRTRGRR